MTLSNARIPIQRASLIFFLVFSLSHCYDESASNFYIAREHYLLIKKGKVSRTRANSLKVIKYMKKSLRHNPDNKFIHLVLEQFLLEFQLLPEAVQHFEQDLITDPNNFKTHMQLAMIHSKTGPNSVKDIHKAQKHLYRAEELLDKSNPNQLSFMAGLYSQNHRYDKGIEYYESALKLSPENPEINNNLAYFLATANDKRYRDPKRSLTLAKKALRLSNSKRHHIIDTVAEAYYVNGEYQKAVNYEKIAIQRCKSPDDRAIYKENLQRYQNALKSHRKP